MTHRRPVNDNPRFASPNDSSPRTLGRSFDDMVKQLSSLFNEYGRAVNDLIRDPPSILYTKDDGQGPITTTLTDITFNTKVKDEWDAFDGTTFTAPADGLYLVSLSVSHTNVGVVAGDRFRNQIDISGGAQIFGQEIVIPTADFNSYPLTVAVSLDEGDTAKVVLIRAGGTGSWTCRTGPVYQWLNIVRVPP